jgi:hypothetical protein
VSERRKCGIELQGESSPVPFKEAFMVKAADLTGILEHFKLRQDRIRGLWCCTRWLQIIFGADPKNGGLNYSKGNKKLFYTWKGVALRQNTVTAISTTYKRFLLLSTHGFINIWDNWEKIHSGSGKYKQKKLLRIPTTRVKPLSIRSNIWTIFYVYLLCINYTSCYLRRNLFYKFPFSLLFIVYTN